MYVSQAPTGTIRLPSRLWRRTSTTRYGAGGGRDVLIVAPDLSLPHPMAVARRPGQLTEEDKLKLQRQGVHLDSQEELDILEARCKLDKECKIVGIKTGQSLSKKEIIKSITHLLNTTTNDGGRWIPYKSQHQVLNYMRFI